MKIITANLTMWHGKWNKNDCLGIELYNKILGIIGMGHIGQILTQKAGELSKGSYLASDAFFPFADGVEEAGRAGVRAIIQPGGSKRDAEVIAMANALGMIMVFTNHRCFKH